MSDLIALLSSDRTIKAVLNNDTTVKAVLLNGVTVNQKIDGGEYIHFAVTTDGNNQIFTSTTLGQYILNTSINLFKNGVYIPPTQFEKVGNNSLRINTELLTGDSIDILATGSAAIVPIANSTPGGSSTQVQYNKYGSLAADDGFRYDWPNAIVYMANANIATANAAIGNITQLYADNANITNLVVTGSITTGTQDAFSVETLAANVVSANTINGLDAIIGNITGVNGSFTDLAVTSTFNVTALAATGTVSASTLSAPTVATDNIVAVDSTVSNTSSMNNIIATGNVTLGTVANVHVAGGTNGQYLQTDGAGNLTWATGTGGGGGGTPGGSNTQIQFNDAGAFGANSTFTFNKSSGTLTVGNVSGKIITAAQPNITSVGTLTALTVTGNSTLSTVKTDNLLYANGVAWQFVASAAGSNTQLQYNDNGQLAANASLTFNQTTGVLTATQFSGAYTGSGAALTNLSAANVVGTVANSAYATAAGTATSATTAGTVTTAAQPNITSTGILSSLAVTGNITAGNIIGNYSGSGAALTNLPAANVVGTVANSAYATEAGTATTATTAGTATSASTAGIVTTAAQPFITSTGTLTSLTVTGNVNAGNIVGAHSGSGAGLSSIVGANVTGYVLNAFTAVSAGTATSATNATTAGTAGTAGTVTTAAQPNITSVGTLTVLTVTGDGIFGNVRTDNLKYSNGIAWSFYSNTNVAAYLPTYTGTTAAGNATITGTATVGTVKTNTLQYANGVAWIFYGDSNVAAYLPTYTGNLKGGNITVTTTAALGTVKTDNLQYANGVAYPTYGNTQVAAYLPTYSGNIAAGNLSITTTATLGTVKTDNLQYANGVAYPIAAYGNSNVAAYLPTYTGNINASITKSAQTGITSIGTLASLAVTGTVTAGAFSGNGAALTNITSATAGTVTTAAQPNITSTGTLTSVTVSGTATIANTALTKFNETVLTAVNTSTAITPNLALGTIFKYTANANFTLNALSNAVAGSSATIIITQDTTGSRILTANSLYKFSNSNKVLSTAASATDIISVFYDGTTYYASLSKAYY